MKASIVVSALSLVCCLACEVNSKGPQTGTQVGNPGSCQLFLRAPPDTCAGRAEPRATEVLTAESLVDTLASGCPGDVVTLTGTRYTGAFQVPPGVRLQGRGPVEIVATEQATAALCVAGGLTAEQPTSITDLSVTSAGRGIWAARGQVRLADLSVTFRSNVGALLDDLEQITLAGLTIKGPIEAPAALEAITDPLDAELAPVAGIVARHSQVELSAVSVSGTTAFGVVLYEGNADWTGGRAQALGGTAVLVEGGQASLTDVAVERIWGRQAAQVDRLDPGVTGVTASAGAVLETDRLTLADIAGPGILQDHARSSHRGIVVSGAKGGGIRVQRSPGIEAHAALEVQGAEITDCTGTGILLREVGGARLFDVKVEGTGIFQEPAMDGTLVPVADGIQIDAPSGLFELSRIALNGNVRAGLFVDGLGAGAEAPESFVFSEVAASSVAEDGFGLIVQNFTAAPPALAVARDAEVAARDEALRLRGLVLGLSAIVPGIPSLPDRVADALEP